MSGNSNESTRLQATRFISNMFNDIFFCIISTNLCTFSKFIDLIETRLCSVVYRDDIDVGQHQRIWLLLFHLFFISFTVIHFVFALLAPIEISNDPNSRNRMFYFGINLLIEIENRKTLQPTNGCKHLKIDDSEQS